MAKRPATTRIAQPDAIRIVPLHTPAAAEKRAAAAALPKLTYRKGPLIRAVEVFTIFWGDGWKAKPQSDLVAKVNAFFDVVVTSPLMDQLAEYNAPGLTIGHGKRTGSITIPAKSPASLTDAAIQTFL